MFRSTILAISILGAIASQASAGSHLEICALVGESMKSMVMGNISLVTAIANGASETAQLAGKEALPVIEKHKDIQEEMILRNVEMITALGNAMKAHCG